jgi:hypothetical protein
MFLPQRHLIEKLGPRSWDRPLSPSETTEKSATGYQ